MEKPRFFDIIGWSWFIMGVFGILSSLLGLLSLPTINQAKTMFGRGAFGAVPGMSDMLISSLNLIVPVTLAQLVFSAVMTVFGWYFLERKNWARWGLSICNMIGIATVLLVFKLTYDFVQKLMGMLSGPAFLEAAINFQLPPLFYVVF